MRSIHKFFYEYSQLSVFVNKSVKIGWCKYEQLHYFETSSSLTCKALPFKSILNLLKDKKLKSVSKHFIKTKKLFRSISLSQDNYDFEYYCDYLGNKFYFSKKMLKLISLFMNNSGYSFKDIQNYIKSDIDKNHKHLYTIAWENDSGVISLSKAVSKYNSPEKAVDGRWYKQDIIGSFFMEEDNINEMDLVQGVYSDKLKKEYVKNIRNTFVRDLEYKIIFDSAIILHEEVKKYMQLPKTNHKIIKHDEIDSNFYKHIFNTILLARLWVDQHHKNIYNECNLLSRTIIQNVYIILKNIPNLLGKSYTQNDFIRTYIYEFRDKTKIKNTDVQNTFFDTLDFFDFTTAYKYDGETNIKMENILTEDIFSDIDFLRNIEYTQQSLQDLYYIPKLLDFIVFCSYYMKKENASNILNNPNKLILDDEEKNIMNILSKCSLDLEIDKKELQFVYKYFYILSSTFFKDIYQNIEKDIHIAVLRNIFIRHGQVTKTPITIKRYIQDDIKPVYFFQALVCDSSNDSSENSN